MAAEHRNRLRLTSRTLESFANFPGVAGCMTRMVVGEQCGNHVRRMERYLPQAKARVANEFAFVGIHEHPRASICLFHRMFGTRMHPLVSNNLTQKKSVAIERKYGSIIDQEKLMHSSDVQKTNQQQNFTQVPVLLHRATRLPPNEFRSLNQAHDQEDEEIYRVARNTFNQRLVQFGFKTIPKSKSPHINIQG